MGCFLTIFLAVFIGIGSIFGCYNSVVSLNEAVDSQYHQVENQMQRRADLIPNLVSTVKGYAAHEKGVFEQVTIAREKLMAARGVSDLDTAGRNLNSALANLLAVAEDYPDLKASKNFIQLQDELAGTENRIAVARMDYNNTVRAYNTKIKSLPYSLFLSFFGFKEHDYFKVEEKAMHLPQVQF